MFKEFKEFAVKGNVIDLAVGIIIGGAFNGVINSLVNDIVMPPLGLVISKVNFADLFINLSGRHYATLAAAKSAAAPTVNYGLFINSIINFLIVAFAVFLLVRQINSFRKRLNMGKEKPVDPTTKQCPFCFSEINIKATRCPECTSELRAREAGI